MSHFNPLALSLVLLLGVSAPAASAQPAPATAEEVSAAYAQHCSGCHGSDARGSQQGPGLAGNLQVRRRSMRSLQNVISKGVPAAGMPAFDLPERMVDGLAKLVISLNASAAETEVAGDRAAGEKFFFGAGGCAKCHMAAGSGNPIGPDLSSVAQERTVDQLRESLLQPNAIIADGYGLVRLRLNDGRTVRGFERNRTRYNIVVQDLEGGIHPLALDEVAEVTAEDSSPMPAVQASEAELQDLLAYLSGLRGVGPETSAGPQPPEADGVSFARILEADPKDWLTHNGDVRGNRYTKLDQINASNVAGLTLKWAYSIPLWRQFLPDTPYYHENMRYFGLETVPIVVDGVMYVTGPNQVFAIDARSGTEIWHYARPRTSGLVSDPSLGTNRGVAILDDKVFMVTDDARLLALNRVTGSLVWEVLMPLEKQRYGGTVAPLIVKDMVVAGVAGGDWGIRGFLAAYKADSGELAWRHWTVPAEGEPGIETWEGPGYKLGGGSTWLTGSYDADTDMLFWATGNPWPNSDDSERGGDNLFTDSVLALDPDDGKLQWYYQFTPHDTHDWDAAVPNVLIDADYRGEPRKLLLHADRNGFFYVFDRTDGELLLAEPFVRNVTWTNGIGADGRPMPAPESALSCPDHATNWNSTSYSPTTRLYYVMVTERCRVNRLPGSWKAPPPAVEPGQNYVRALNIETGEIVWEVPQVGPVDGKRYAGIMGTAGGLLFYGDPSGYLVAADERDGTTLWRLPLNATFKTAPMSYSVDGPQYITVAVGSNVMTFGLPD